MITLYYVHRIGDCGDGCCSWDESYVSHDHYGFHDDVATEVGYISDKEGLDEWCDRNVDRLWWIINPNPNESIPHDWDWRTKYKIDESLCEWA